MRQALEIPFKILSVADTDKVCQQFIQANFTVEHMHPSLEAQRDGQTCLQHRLAGGCCLCLGSTLGCSGTPCKPYSQQRAKRWQDGSIKNHADNGLTENELVSWLAQTCPEAGFFENVPGWDMPEHKGADRTDTPMARQ